jgi:hypothetical protein
LVAGEVEKVEAGTAPRRKATVVVTQRILLGVMSDKSDRERVEDIPAMGFERTAGELVAGTIVQVARQGAERHRQCMVEALHSDMASGVEWSGCMLAVENNSEIVSTVVDEIWMRAERGCEQGESLRTSEALLEVR